MVNYYTTLSRLRNLPERRIGSYLLRETKTSQFAGQNKLYAISGDIEKSSNPLLPNLKMVEEYFTKVGSNAKWFDRFPLLKKIFSKNKTENYFGELPIFKKITESVPEYADRGMRITRTNGKGLSTVTTLDENGIRGMKVKKQLSKDGTHFECTRYVYNEKGTEPTVVSQWTQPK